MSKKNQFIVAVKDVSSGKILPGKILGKYREYEFASRDTFRLARRQGVEVSSIGIFLNKRLVSSYKGKVFYE